MGRSNNDVPVHAPVLLLWTSGLTGKGITLRATKTSIQTVSNCITSKLTPKELCPIAVSKSLKSVAVSGRLIPLLIIHVCWTRLRSEHYLGTHTAMFFCWASSLLSYACYNPPSVTSNVIADASKTEQIATNPRLQIQSLALVNGKFSCTYRAACVVCFRLSKDLL